MPIPVSVVVVSRDRPEALYRCVLGLSQVQYDGFEIVVVADFKGLEALGSFERKIKTVLFDEANISAARNVGIGQAAGEVIAFIDDDAVPKPNWLTYLVAPLEKPEVDAVGGFVLGRNGISFQWKARVIGCDGQSVKIDVDEVNPTVLTPPSGRAVKTEGTNMAVRRAVLVDLGGFDPAYHFYLDETDLNMRLAVNNCRTAIAPLALVHHGFAKSIRRRADRVPSDLFDIGASWAVFHRKFALEAERQSQWDTIVRSERNRLIGYLVSGGLEPKSVRSLLARLHSGYQAGKSRKSVADYSLRLAPPLFKEFPFKLRKSVFLSGRSLAVKKLRLDASARVKDSKIVTLLILSPTAFFHSVQFQCDGYWVQSGGLFGKSDRGQRLFRFWSLKKRCDFERKRADAVTD